MSGNPHAVTDIHIRADDHRLTGRNEQKLSVRNFNQEKTCCQ